MHSIIDISVSILVFVELALDARGKMNGSSHQGIVSILVFVELALDVLRSAASGLRFLVSILVFVELALDDSRISGTEGVYCGFQSLFSWNLLLMASPAKGSPTRSLVSILVFVELALDALCMAACMLACYSFNPCFRGTCS